MALVQYIIYLHGTAGRALDFPLYYIFSLCPGVDRVKWCHREPQLPCALPTQPQLLLDNQRHGVS
jgi:hypothetical protein